MIDTNSPEFARRTSTLAKMVNAQIGKFESDPTVIIAVLGRLHALAIVTETMHLNFSEVSQQAVDAFRKELKSAKKGLDFIVQQEGKANDDG